MVWYHGVVAWCASMGSVRAPSLMLGARRCAHGASVWLQFACGAMARLGTVAPRLILLISSFTRYDARSISCAEVELTILRNTDSTLVITREVSRVLEPDRQHVAPAAASSSMSDALRNTPGVPEPTTPDTAPPPEASERSVRPPKSLGLDDMRDTTDAAGAGEIEEALRHRAEVGPDMGPESPTPPNKPAKHAKCPVTHRQPVYVPRDALPGRREPHHRREGLAASLELRPRGRTEGAVVEPDPRRAGLLPRVAFASAAPDTPASAAPAALRIPISISTPAAVAETDARGADLLVVEPSAVVRSLLSRFTLRGLSCAFTDDAESAVELVRSGGHFKVGTAVDGRRAMGATTALAPPRRAVQCNEFVMSSFQRVCQQHLCLSARRRSC